MKWIKFLGIRADENLIKANLHLDENCLNQIYLYAWASKKLKKMQTKACYPYSFQYNSIVIQYLFFPWAQHLLS